MSKQNTHSTRKSIGFLSEKEIDIWGNEGKRKARLFQKNNSKTNPPTIRKKSINNEEQMQLALNSTLNHLRDKTRSQRSNSSSLSNRMKYLEVDLMRKKQMVEIAKNKYQKMIEVRHQSFIEKKMLSKERSEQLRKRNLTVSNKVSRIKLQRDNSAISQRNRKQKNQAEALKLRESRINNEKFISDRQRLEVQSKRQLVQKTQVGLSMSRSKLNQTKNQKIEQGKRQHQLKLLQEYLKSQMQKKNNTKLASAFQVKVKKIEADSIKFNKELQDYERLLGLKGSSSSNKKDHFFVTH